MSISLDKKIDEVEKIIVDTSRKFGVNTEALATLLLAYEVRRLKETLQNK